MSSMKNIMKEWRSYNKEVLKEQTFGQAVKNFANNYKDSALYKAMKPHNQSSYNDAIEVIQKWKRRETVSKSELIDAAKWITSNDNERYWRWAGQSGTAADPKGAAPDSIWETARDIVYKMAGGASSMEAISGQAPVAGALMKKNQQAREILKINIPFLDPSANPNNHIHPYWLTGPYKATVGRILQSAANLFLDPLSIMYIVLVFLTGGLAGTAMLGRVAKAMKTIHDALEFEALTEKVLEILKPFLQRSIQRILGIGVQKGAQETWEIFFRRVFGQVSEKGFSHSVEHGAEHGPELAHEGVKRIQEEILVDFENTAKSLEALMKGQTDYKSPV